MVECDFPECTTFGAVIRYALELEKGAAGVYDELAKEPKAASTSAMFMELAESHRKRGKLLEFTRQQKLNEMILEPISDLKREDYMISTKTPRSVDAKAAAKFAAAIEGTSSKFYLDSARVAKNLMAEAARIMEKLGKENLANKAKLEAV